MPLTANTPCWETKMSILDDITDKVLRDRDALVSAANAAAKAHFEEIGDSTDYKRFGEEDVERVAANLPWLYAIVESLGIGGLMIGRTDDEGYASVLRAIASTDGDLEKMGEEERFVIRISMRVAHATWMSSLVFRDMANNPFSRISGPEVEVFDRLRHFGQDSYIPRVRDAARWLCGELGIDWQTV